MLFLVTVEASAEVEADSYEEARKNFDMMDAELERIVCVECIYDDEDEEYDDE